MSAGGSAGGGGETGPEEPQDAEPEETEPEETEPDARFTFANERTFLAWNRTALAMVIGGVAIVQLLPPFSGLPWGRHLLAVSLIAFGSFLSIGSFFEWERNQRALRRSEPMPRSPLPLVLAIVIAAVAGMAAVLVVLSGVLG
ncbi:MAG TPA: DUF202 domain-containing protein [Vulgatibacteraceae bacterium]|nr:DUF202 domain-containing protein [Vulgatibacteraceae bacterium]